VTAPANDTPASVKKAPRQPKSAETRSHDVDAGDARHLRRRPFIADIGDGDREDRRQQQTLKEAPGDERLHVGRERRAGHGHDHSEHCSSDDALPPQNVGNGTGERRGQGDGERARGHDRADLGGADAELTRQRRQRRLRRIEGEEGAEAGNGNGDFAAVDGHGA